MKVDCNYIAKQLQTWSTIVSADNLFCTQHYKCCKVDNPYKMYSIVVYSIVVYEEVFASVLQSMKHPFLNVCTLVLYLVMQSVSLIEQLLNGPIQSRLSLFDASVSSQLVKCVCLHGSTLELIASGNSSHCQGQVSTLDQALAFCVQAQSHKFAITVIFIEFNLYELKSKGL